MKTVRILNVEPVGYCEEAKAILAQLGEVVEAPLSRAELLSELPSYDVLIVRLAYKVDRDVIDAGSHLKVIVTATTGLDHIDLEYAHSRGIAILSLFGETEFLQTVSATAEHTWALLLALMRRIPSAFASVQHGEWVRDAFRGYELDGRRLGLVGLGRIGCKVANYGLAFGMKVAAHDPYTVEWAAGIERLGDMGKLLSRSDILSLHVPLNRETTCLIGVRELALLPPGAVLINTSRGEVIDETALIQALECKQLAGAALDVIHYERDPQQRDRSQLLTYARTHDNLLVTPHIGGITHESMAKTEIFMAQKLATWLSSTLARDKPPINPF